MARRRTLPALLFDEQYRARPASFGVEDAFLRR
jgi:hypothetical protein